MAKLVLKTWGCVMAFGAIKGAYNGATKWKSNVGHYTFTVNNKQKHDIKYSFDGTTASDCIANAVFGSLFGAIAYGPLLPLNILFALEFVNNMDGFESGSGSGSVDVNLDVNLDKSVDKSVDVNPNTTTTTTVELN